jgi:hypothetical protein
LPAGLIPRNAKSGPIRELNLSAGNRRADEWILGEKRSAIEIRVIEKRRDLSDRGDSKTRFDHASGHHRHAECSRDVNHSQRFAQTAAFCQLDVDPIDGSGKFGNIGRHQTRFISENGQL